MSLAISRSMFGWMNVPMTPPISMWTPMTASSSGCDQPLRAAVWLKTSAEHGEPGAERDQRLEQLEPEVGAVLELVERPDPEEEPRAGGAGASA